MLLKIHDLPIFHAACSWLTFKSDKSHLVNVHHCRAPHVKILAIPLTICDWQHGKGSEPGVQYYTFCTIVAVFKIILLETLTIFC